MKKIFTVLAIVLFTISASAQDAKTTKDKEKSCCTKSMTAEEVAKCKAKCKAEDKVCTADKKEVCKKEEKKCCAKKA